MNQDNTSGLGSNNFPFPSFSISASNDISLPIALPSYTMSDTFSTMMRSEQHSRDNDDKGDPSPLRNNGPSPPVSPIPLMLPVEEPIMAAPLACTTASFPSTHSNTSTHSNPSVVTPSTCPNSAPCPLAAAAKPGYGVNPSALPTKPPCPLNKERLECTEKGYGVHVQGTFIQMPPPPPGITLHKNPVEPLMDTCDKAIQPAVVYSSAAAYTPIGVAYSTNSDHTQAQSGTTTPNSHNQTPNGSVHPSHNNSPMFTSNSVNMTAPSTVHYAMPAHTYANTAMYSHASMTSQPMAVQEMHTSPMYHQLPVPHVQMTMPSFNTAPVGSVNTPMQGYPSHPTSLLPSTITPQSHTMPQYQHHSRGMEDGSKQSSLRPISHTNSQSNDEDSGDDHHEDETGLTPDEIKKRRLRRKAELARASRLSKKNKLQELESECANLRQQLAEARNAQVASVGVGLSDIQGALQSIANVIVPALQVLSGQTHIPASVNGVALSPVQPGTNAGAQTAALIANTASRTMEAASVVAKSLPAMQFPLPPQLHMNPPLPIAGHPYTSSHHSQGMSNQLTMAMAKATAPQATYLQASNSGNSDADQSSRNGRRNRGVSPK